MAELSSFGRELRERRRSCDLTQERLADLVGCAPITIKRIEYGTLRPSRLIAERLAAALGVPAQEQQGFIDCARAAPPEPAVGAAPGTSRGYVVRARIGSGLLGTVYRAEQPAVARDVAMKVILPQLASQPEFIRRFEAEARLVAQLEQPQIVPLYDYWRDRTGAYLVMRLMRGGSLQARLGQRWELGAVMRLADEVGSALHAAHRHDILHREVKPANILLDEDGGAHLADFGIARGDNVAVEDGRLVTGAADYHSPEQLRGAPATPAADLYSLALVLYELLAGVRLFANLAAGERIARRLTQPLPPLQPLRPDVPAGLDDVLARASDPDPARRYGDAPALIDDLVRAIGKGARHASVRQWLSAAGESESMTRTRIAAHVLENPYRSLRAFQTADAGLFFGRAALTQRLIARLSEPHRAARFLAVVGPSGSGKSSAVRAGLIPALQRGELPGAERWFVAQLTPGAHPLEEIEAALLRMSVNPPASLMEQLCANERGLARAVRRCLPEDDQIELVLLVDQFEELFTATVDEAERAHVLRMLAAAITDPRARLWLVVTLRADFFDRPLAYSGFAELLRERTEVVTPLMESEVEQAITRPAAQVGVGVEPQLVRQLLRDVAAQPGALPLLQYTLTELFDRAAQTMATQRPMMLRQADYAAIGGIGGAIAQRADRLVDGLGTADKLLVRQLCLRLVQPGDGAEDTRRRIAVAELPAAAAGLLGQLDAARLVTFDRDRHTGEPTVELAHEALLTFWGRLRRWVEEGRAMLLVYRRLTALASEWERAGRDASFLAAGTRLAQLEELAGADIDLSESESAFLSASIAERERAAAEERRRMAELRASLMRTEARRLAAEANRLLQAGGNAELCALLALRSIELCYTPEGDEALASAARLAYPVCILPGRSESVAITPDGAAALLTDGADARLVEIASGSELCRLVGHTADISRVALSQEGRLAFTASYDGTARVWELTTGRLLHVLAGHVGAINGLAIMPDDQRIATCGGDGTVRLWDTRTGAQLTSLSASSLSLQTVTFSPTGDLLAVGGHDQIVRVYDVRTGTLQLSVPGEDSVVVCLAYAPDGQALLAGCSSGVMRLLDAATGTKIWQQVGHRMEVNCAQFTRDGNRVLTGGNDGTVRVWDSRTGVELRHLAGHNAFVFGIALAPDERQLISTSSESDARLWAMQALPALPQYAGQPALFVSGGDNVVALSSTAVIVYDSGTGAEIRRMARLPLSCEAVAVDSSGRWLLTGDGDSRARLWDLEQGRLVRELAGHTAPLRAVAFSPDGHYLLTGGYDFSARLWDRQSGALLHSFEAHRWIVFGVAFSADGRRIATASVDGTTRVWDVQTRDELLAIPCGAACVAFTPDGCALVTGDWDGMVRIWNLADGAERHSLTGHITTVWNLRISSDGRLLLTASGDGTARLWSMASGAELRRLSGHVGGAITVDLSGDGQFALSCGVDGVARLWDIDVRVTMARLRERLLRGFSERERLQYSLDA